MEMALTAALYCASISVTCLQLDERLNCLTEGENGMPLSAVRGVKFLRDVEGALIKVV